METVSDTGSDEWNVKSSGPEEGGTGLREVDGSNNV